MPIAAIVDVETTGLDPLQNEIIEIGLLTFSYGSEEGPFIIDTYGALEDPGKPIPEEITQLTGITDAQVQGQKIKWDLVKQQLAAAEIVVAHNAPFDRSFLEQRPELAGLSLKWACSVRHIDWQALGFKTRALNYLAADKGFINPFAHRAIFDCATTFRVIQDHVDQMVARSIEREVFIRAFGAPFEVKDVLKNRAYRWDPKERVWGRLVFESQLEEERVFLREEIYQGASQHDETEISK